MRSVALLAETQPSENASAVSSISFSGRCRSSPMTFRSIKGLTDAGTRNELIDRARMRLDTSARMPRRCLRSATTAGQSGASASTIPVGRFSDNACSPSVQREATLPDHDLVALWEAHTRTEFETRDVDGTMATMVAQPYVNHIPTMTGGVGHDQLKRFYKYHFIGANPPDTSMKLISRTVGANSLVDEILFSFTHTSEIDWMLPGIQPTGRKVEIPLVAIVQFSGEKLVHEHIYWDQASVLVQIGVLDPNSLPVAGAETAHKAMDRGLPSNTLMANWRSSEGKPI